MQKTIKTIPDGYHTITPYLIIQHAADAIVFYKKAFNAIEIMRIEKPDGSIGHAEIQIGNSRLMLAEESPSMNFNSPKALKGTSVMIHLYVEDVDTLFHQAITAGGTQIKPVADQFYGDRLGVLIDPFGHNWSIATHKEDLTEEEIHRRAANMPHSK